MANTPVHSLRVEEKLWQRLVAAAEDHGVTKTVIIRDAIEYYLERLGK